MSSFHEVKLKVNLCVCWVAHLLDEVLSCFHGLFSFIGISIMSCRKKIDEVNADMKLGSLFHL